MTQSIGKLILNCGSPRVRQVQARARGESLPLGEIARLLQAGGAGLDGAHARGAAHRAAKPATVLSR